MRLYVGGECGTITPGSDGTIGGAGAHTEGGTIGRRTDMAGIG